MTAHVTRQTHNAKVKELNARIEVLENDLISATIRADRHESIASDAKNAVAAEEAKRQAVIDGIKMAYNTLHQVDADENNTALLVRVLGNVQGLLQAMLLKATNDKSGKYQNEYVPPLRVYNRHEIKDGKTFRPQSFLGDALKRSLYRED